MDPVKQLVRKWAAARHLMPGSAALLCLLVSCLIVAVLLAVGPTFLDPRGPLSTMTAVVGLVGLVALILWRFDHDHPVASRLILLASGLAFLILAWDVIRLLNHTTMALASPLADELLARWDAALGLDWPAYFDWVGSSPLWRGLMAQSYTSLTFLSLLAYLLLCLFSHPRRSIYFLETFTFTAVFCTLSGALFPARAAVDYYLGAGADLSAFPLEPGLYHLTSLERLRSGAPVELVLGNLPGLVTFPSFHTAAGLLLVAATWRSWLVIPTALYAAVMIASTPVYGGHYFIDLAAGAVVALAIAWAWARHPKNAGLFGPVRVAAPLRHERQ